jgi:hypothetical protein
MCCVLCEVRTQILYTIEKQSGLQTLPLLRQLVAGLSSRIPVIDPRSVHVGSVVEKMAMGQVFLRILRYYPVCIILAMLHTPLPSTLHTYQKDKTTKHRDLRKKNGFSYLGERYIEKCIYFLSFFKMLTASNYEKGYWSS